MRKLYVFLSVQMNIFFIFLIIIIISLSRGEHYKCLIREQLHPPRHQKSAAAVGSLVILRQAGRQ